MDPGAPHPGGWAAQARALLVAPKPLSLRRGSLHLSRENQAADRRAQVPGKGVRHALCGRASFCSHLAAVGWAPAHAVWAAGEQAVVSAAA